MEGLSHCTLVGELRAYLKGPAPIAPKRAASSTGRHVAWHSDGYVCVREGKVFENRAQLDVAYKEGSLSEDVFYIFKHADPNTERNEEIPLYEAVYMCKGDGYIKAQKKHLKQAYCASQRNDTQRMRDILEDGTPYWVDRFIFCKEKARACKRRYENKRK